MGTLVRDACRTSSADETIPQHLEGSGYWVQVKDDEDRWDWCHPRKSTYGDNYSLQLSKPTTQKSKDMKTGTSYDSEWSEHDAWEKTSITNEQLQKSTKWLEAPTLHHQLWWHKDPGLARGSWKTLKEEEWKWSPSSFPIEGHKVTLMTMTLTDEAARRRNQGWVYCLRPQRQEANTYKTVTLGGVSTIFTH